jgi:deoxyribodipyrimidine photo-lyase
MDKIFTPTRAAGRDRLAAFLPRAGAAYAVERNADTGPGLRANVSMLSPYIRYRLVTEAEIASAVQARHGQAGQKFIDEVCWRTYWKGWLEARPGIWRQYQTACAALAAAGNIGVAQALAGRTGIDCFDAWAAELVETGYLHNHARMWFASIWVHTLRLPWELGAEFFAWYLLDGDPASNTLSWRWVAGLHTKGKAYLARADNIARYTGGRFQPRGLADEPLLIEAPGPPRAAPVPALPRHPAGRVGLLLHEEDLAPESLDLAGCEVTGAALLRAQASAAAPVLAFIDAALDDTARRAAEWFGVAAMRLDAETEAQAEAMIAWAAGLGVRQLVTAYAPIGPAADRLAALGPPLAAAGISLTPVRRAWDDFAWPYATKGFFAFRQCIPELVAA